MPLLTRLKESTSRLSATLRQEISAVDLSLRAKMPFKAAVIVEALGYRVVDFANSSIILHEHGITIPSITLARSAIETMSLCYSIHRKIEGCLRNKATAGIDTLLMKYLFGQRFGDDVLPESVNILTMIDKFESVIPGFKKYYSQLCEYAHPNMYGTKSAYSRTFQEKCRVKFGVPYSQNMTETSINAMTMAIELFEYYRDEINNLMPTFTVLCESILSNPTAGHL